MTLKAREETRVSSTPVTSDPVADRRTSLENPADRSTRPHTTSRSCKRTRRSAKAAGWLDFQLAPHQTRRAENVEDQVVCQGCLSRNDERSLFGEVP